MHLMNIVNNYLYIKICLPIDWTYLYLSNIKEFSKEFSKNFPKLMNLLIYKIYSLLSDITFALSPFHIFFASSSKMFESSKGETCPDNS